MLNVRERERDVCVSVEKERGEDKTESERNKNWNIQNSINFDGHDNNLLIDTSFRCKMIFLTNQKN